MIIKGANIGNVSVSLNDLSSYEYTKDDKLKKAIFNIEKLYKDIKNKSSSEEINLIPIDENSCVELNTHALNHSCSSDIEVLRTISKYGILASEWFGELESEREGCFCTFVSRLKGPNYQMKGSLAEDDYSRLNIGNGVVLFFDDKNPLLQYLIHLDYFEFEYQKKNNPDYKSLYSQEELQILEGLIETFSPCGKDMRKSFDSKTNYWSAIPGGIPSEFVNGICIKKNNYSEEELDEISLLFPNAVIFNSNKEVIRQPNVSINHQVKQ